MHPARAPVREEVDWRLLAKRALAASPTSCPDSRRRPSQCISRRLSCSVVVAFSSLIGGPRAGSSRASEFPSVAARGSGETADLPERFAELVVPLRATWAAAASSVHVLSHRRLTVQVVRASLDGKIVPAAGSTGGVYDDVRFALGSSRLGTLPRAALTDRVLALA